VVIGFNSLGFDRLLLEVNGIRYPAHANYDLLAELWMAAGLLPEYSGAIHNGFGLDATAEANQIGNKSGHGALAPVDWQRGHISTVVDYCLHDVWLTKQLIDLLVKQGWLNDPRDRFKILEVDKPFA
jgi:hypothetical protein